MTQSTQKNDPNERLKVLECWSQRATLAILAGIIVELWALWYFVHDPIEWIWLALGNVLIGAGLIAQYIVIGRAVVANIAAKMESDERVAESDRLARAAQAQANAQAAEADTRAAEANARAAEANARAAEANARALEAQAEFEKFRAPPPFNATVFAKELNGKAPWPVKEILYVDSQDCLALAGQIAEALSEAKWPVATAPRPLRVVNPNSMLPPEILEFLPRTATYGGQHWGVSVIAKRSIDDQSPQNSLIWAIAKALPSQNASGGRDPWMEDGMLRIVVAPKH
jgi:hypothetical protein